MRMTVYLAELSAALLDSVIEAAVPSSRPNSSYIDVDGLLNCSSIHSSLLYSFAAFAMVV